MSNPARPKRGKRDTCPDKRVADRAATRFGIVTRADAVGLGLTPRMITHRLAAGRWRRLARGIYAIAGAPDTYEQRALAACLASGDGAVLSHQSAGAVWGLPGCERARQPGQPIDVLVPHRRGRRHNALATVHRSRRLSAPDRAWRGALPLTTPARTLIDLAEPVPERASGVAGSRHDATFRSAVGEDAGWDDRLADQVDEAVCSDLVAIDRLRRRVGVVCGRGRRGTRRIRSVLASWSAGATKISPPEARLDRWMQAEGLGGVRQHGVTVDGKSFFFDRAWPDARIGLEVDSYRWHGTPRGRRRTSDRAARLRAAGWELHSVTPDQVDRRDPYVTMALRAAMARQNATTANEHGAATRVFPQ